MIKYKWIFAVILAVALFGCKQPEPPAPYRYEANPKFSWGFADFYGNYYQNYDISNNVLTLNLFTEKLSVNEKNTLVGTGQYLIIEDIFSEPGDTLLRSGTYKVAETGEPFTFFSGKKFEDNREAIPSGAYIYYIEADPTKSKIAYIKEGTMEVSTEDGEFCSINCDFTLDDKTNLKGTFNSKLIYFDLVATTPAGVKREKVKVSLPIN